MKQNTAMENLNKAFELFEKYDETTYEKEVVTDDFIQKVEQAFEFKIPSTYRLFLKKYGGYNFFATDFLGVSPEAIQKNANYCDVSTWCDAFKITRDNRNDYQLPSKYIIVGNSGYGPLDAIDTSKPDEHGECPVVMIDGPYKNPDTGEKKEWYEMEQMAPDFGTYLYNQSKAALQNSIDSGEVEA